MGYAVGLEELFPIDDQRSLAGDLLLLLHKPEWNRYLTLADIQNHFIETDRPSLIGVVNLLAGSGYVAPWIDPVIGTTGWYCTGMGNTWVEDRILKSWLDPDEGDI